MTNLSEAMHNERRSSHDEDIGAHDGDLITEKIDQAMAKEMVVGLVQIEFWRGRTATRPRVIGFWMEAPITNR